MHAYKQPFITHIYYYEYTVYYKTFEWENFRSCTQNTLFAGNFRGASGHGHHVLYTASDSRGKLLQSAEKPQRYSHSKFCCIRYAI